MAHYFRQITRVSALFLMVGVTACARLDSGAPVEWGSGFQPYEGHVAQPASKPSAYQVEVQPGENLYRIAKRNNMKVEEIVAVNELEPPYAVQLGQTLKVAEPQFHVVQRGETLYGLSQHYGMEQEELAALNGINYPYTLSPGQRLSLAGTGSIKSAPPSTLYAGRSIPVPPKSVNATKPVKQVAYAPAPKPRKETNLWQKLRGESKPLPPTVGSNGFLWPVRGKILSSYGSKQNGLHNDGINIAVERGTKVRAAKDGIVTYAGNELRGYGNLVLIKHADGYVTAYAHNEKILVKRGEQVRQGQVISKAGATGAVTTPQVHFEIRKGRNAVNPRSHLKGV